MSSYDDTNNIVEWKSLVIIARKHRSSRIRRRVFKRNRGSAMGMDEPCPICFGEQGDGNTHRTSCGHIFHKTCVEKWKACGRTSCPMCRKQFLEVEE